MTERHTDSNTVAESNLIFTHDANEHQLLRLQENAAKQYHLPINFQDRLQNDEKAPEMIIIPAGRFAMGSTKDEHGHHESEAPLHYVSIYQSFAIGRFAITAKDFEHFQNQTEWHLRRDLIWAKGNHPVINIRLHDAKLYAKWLSQQTGHKYRLPREAEWEYAARAGSSTPFYFGDNVTCKDVHFNPNQPYKADKPKRKFWMPRCLPVHSAVECGSKLTNLWGLHEMHGNVWEFTDSPWTRSHLNANRDGTPNVNVISDWTVTKGGSWFDGAEHARSAARRPRHIEELDTNLGFRLVREL